jgi:hypothetical protein
MSASAMARTFGTMCECRREKRIFAKLRRPGPKLVRLIENRFSFEDAYVAILVTPKELHHTEQDIVSYLYKRPNVDLSIFGIDQKRSESLSELSEGRNLMHGMVYGSGRLALRLAKPVK